MRRSLIAIGFIGILPILTHGQGRAMMPGGSHSTAFAPRPVMHATPTAVVQAVPGARVMMRSVAPRSRPTMPAARSTRRPVSTQRLINTDDVELVPACSSVPGLGFDVPHLAATCGSGAVGTRQSRSQIPFFFPLFESGIFLPSSPVVVEEVPAPEAPQVESAEAEDSNTVRRERISPPAPVAAMATASAVQRASDEYIFVRRDGTVFFAVAYAWENGILRYITGEGLRRSVPRDALDLDATQQFNEQRGLNFRLPA